MIPPEIPGHTPCSVLIWVVLWLAATAILVKLGPQVVNPNRLHSLKTKDRHTRTWYPKTKPTKPHKEAKVCGSRAWVSCLSAPTKWRLNKLTFTSSYQALAWWIGFLTLLMCMQPAAGVNPNMQRDFTTLPGMKMWNGIPYHDFRRAWFSALIVALGSIFQEGWTLIQVARDQDVGGPAQGGTAGQIASSNNRNIRLFHAVLNYIDPNCDLYRRVWTTFNNDGRGLYNYLWVYGHLPYTRREITGMEAEWKDASISALKIPHDKQTVFKWKSWVVTEGEKRNKNLGEIRDKFLEGFPESFNIVVIPERNSTANGGAGNYVHPANYPAHYPDHLAGKPHPNAGEPDMDALASNFNITWVDYIIRGLIKAAPKGSAYQVEEEKDETDNDAEPEASQILAVDGDEYICKISADSITADTVCVSCGGRGHVSRLDGQTCLTTTLGIKIPREELEKTTYPSGITFPKFKFNRTGAARASTSSRQRLPARPKTRTSSGYRSSDDKKMKNRVRVAVQEPEPPQAPESNSEDDDQEASHDIQLAVDLDNIHIQ